MIALGGDPGLEHTGWALVEFEGTSRHLLETGTFHTDAAAPAFLQLRCMASDWRALVHRVRPGLIGVEGFFYQGKRSQNPVALPMSRLVGRFEECADAALIPLVTVDKQRANGALGLHGKTDAARVRRAVEALVPVKPGVLFNERRVLKNAHECDAVLVAVAAYQRFSIEEQLRKRGVTHGRAQNSGSHR